MFQFDFQWATSGRFVVVTVLLVTKALGFFISSCWPPHPLNLNQTIEQPHDTEFQIRPLKPPKMKALDYLRTLNCFSRFDHFKSINLKQVFLASKWTLQCFAGFFLVYCVVSLIWSCFHYEEEKIIRSLNIVFLIAESLAVYYLYTKMVLISFGLSVIGLLIHAVINESLFVLSFALLYIISGSEFMIVATIYKERRLQEILDQRYSAATIY